MNNDKLKKKIIEIMSNVWSLPVPCTAERKFERIADALIAAGLKFDVLTETEYQKYCAYKTIEPQIKGCFDREKELKKRVEEVEHSAEVAERAARIEIMKFLAEYGIYDIPEHEYFQMEIKKEFIEVYQQAEKELAEEEKND